MEEESLRRERFVKDVDFKVRIKSRIVREIWMMRVVNQQWKAQNRSVRDGVNGMELTERQMELTPEAR